jgi:hypothetical protein
MRSRTSNVYRELSKALPRRKNTSRDADRIKFDNKSAVLCLYGGRIKLFRYKRRDSITAATATTMSVGILIPLTVRPYVIIVMCLPALSPARSPAHSLALSPSHLPHRCTKREIVQTSCLMLGAGETWNAINLSQGTRIRPVQSLALQCTAVTIAAEETSASVAAPREIVAAHLSAHFLSLSLPPPLSLSLSSPLPGCIRVTLAREKANQPIVKRPAS